MELDAGNGARLDRGDDLSAVVLDLRDGHAIGRLGRIAVCEVDVDSFETVQERRGATDGKRVPAHVGHAARAQPPHRTAQEAEPAAALLARLEQQLHAHADAERRPSAFRAIAQGVRDVRQAPGRALDVADAGDHRQRRLAHRVRVGRDDRLRAGARQRGRDAAQVPCPVVDEDDVHPSPFVERTPSLLIAQAWRSAWPSALKAASAT